MRIRSSLGKKTAVILTLKKVNDCAQIMYVSQINQIRSWKADENIFSYWSLELYAI